MAQVKICGLSTAETMNAALDAGADFVGLVFYPKSPRNVSLEQAKALADQARGRAKIVALIVDADDQLLVEIARDVRPDYFQAQGHETPERISAIKVLTQTSVIKALSVGGARDVATAELYPMADIILFDAKAPKDALPGGNGLTFDWGVLPRGKSFMLAGGLNPNNVAAAIRRTAAAYVDVSSGVESAPGVKDVNLIRNFIEAAKSAS